MEALHAFQGYDFENDPKWRLYKNNLEVPAGRSEQQVLLKYKAKFYKQHVDPDFDVSAASAQTGRTPEQPPRHANTSSDQKTAPEATKATSTAPSKSEPKPANGASNTGASSSSAAAARAQGWLKTLQQKLQSGRRPSPETIQFGLHFILLWLFLFFAQPFQRRLSYQAWSMFLKVSLATHLYKVYLKAGFPRLKPFPAAPQQWLARVGMSTDFMYAFLSLMFMPQRPITPAVLPIAVLAVYHVFAYASKHFGRTALWQRFGVRAHAWLSAHMRDALMLNAYAEIGTGFFLIVLLFTPARNFLLLFLYFNFLRMRYYSPDVAAYHQQAWVTVDDRVSPIIQRLPILNTPLSMAKRWFHSVAAQR
jgi:hypothetical protein